MCACVCVCRRGMLTHTNMGDRHTHVICSSIPTIHQQIACWNLRAAVSSYSATHKYLHIRVYEYIYRTSRARAFRQIARTSVATHVAKRLEIN